VRLSINNVSQGEKVPNGQLGAAGGINDVSNTTTQLPFQCTWTGLTWQTGTLKAEGLNAPGGAVVCTDQKVTAGAAHHIVLTRQGPIIKPNGEVFSITANGSDVALILATVVDAQGNWCPTATGNITWSVTGPATYRGGSDQFCIGTPGQNMGLHAPLDPELAIEGGKAMVAVRSQFTTGTVTVNASIAGLTQPNASMTYTISPVTDLVVGTGRDVSAAPYVKEGLFTKVIVSGSVIKYYISQTSNISVDIMNANGRIIKKIPASKQLAGWHPVSFTQTPDNAAAGTGVYFIRLAVNGKSLSAKKVMLVR
jgi:hypothetical protein